MIKLQLQQTMKAVAIEIQDSIVQLSELSTEYDPIYSLQIIRYYVSALTYDTWINKP